MFKGREAALAEEAAAAKASDKSSDVTENCTTKTTGEVIDELCPDEEYEIQEKLTNDNSDIFRVIIKESTTFTDEETLDKMKDLIKKSMEKECIQKCDKHFEVVKHEKHPGEFKAFVRVKYKRDVIDAIKNIANDVIEVRKFP